MAHDLKLGLMLGYWGGGPPPGAQETVLEAERLGFDSVWTAEAYGSDVLIPLAWWGAATSTIKLGTAIAQISARTPAATAMAAMSLDHLSGGRMVLGLGVSGPRGDRGGQAAEVEHPSLALPDPDLPRSRRPQEHRDGRRALRRLAGALLLT